jgi:hypothetical protein
LAQKTLLLKNLGETRRLQWPRATDISVAWQLETDMKTKFLLIGGVAAATLLAGGWALAQSAGHDHGGAGPAGRQGMHDQMGRGMHGQMGQGMHGQMGPGMRGQMGPGMHGQMGTGMRGQMGPGMMRGGPGSTFADPARIDTLKTELGITAAQEPAWTKYAKAVQDAAATMKTTRESVNPETVGKLTPQERFAFVSKIREQAQKQRETVQMAANELLTTLDDAQKTKAEQTLPGLAFGPGATRGAGFGGQQHQH